MDQGKAEIDEKIPDEDSPEMEAIHRQIQEDKEKFKRIVLENPLEALKPASIEEVREGLAIVDDDLGTKTRPEERQRKIMELAQEIIKYKTGRDVAEGHQAWSPSTALFLRETLWQQGIVPREFLPTKKERIQATLGKAAGILKDEVRAGALGVKASVTEPFKPPTESNK